jgi:hypothetical protein
MLNEETAVTGIPMEHLVCVIKREAMSDDGHTGVRTGRPFDATACLGSCKFPSLMKLTTAALK